MSSLPFVPAGPQPYSSADLRSWTSDQLGVVSRRQVLSVAGESDASIRRRIRRREWRTLLPGVYVDHTGPPTWGQRAWAAVLWAEPAALCHQSALRVADGPGRRAVAEGGPIHVAVDRDRSVRGVSGVVVHRLVGLDRKVLWQLGPPRVRIEEAVLDIAAEARDEVTAIGVLADAVRSRRTTAARLSAALRGRRRIARRRLLSNVLADVDAGTCSALEQGYLARVERPHGLPRAARQVRESVHGTLYRDVVYDEFGFVVELDGRLFHSRVVDRDRDLERDLDVSVSGRDSVRLGWGQVWDRSCSTATKIGDLLRQRGWDGVPQRCPRCPRTP